MSDHLRNGWYMAGWADEVQPGRILARTVADRPLLIRRAESCEAFCLLDRCPRRLAPLSKEKLEGATVRRIRAGFRVVQLRLRQLRSDATMRWPQDLTSSAARVRWEKMVQHHGARGTDGSVQMAAAANRGERRTREG
jgi:hypothetical protein